MSHTLRRVGLPLFVACFLAGCSATVREDRTLAFTSDGKQVAFQHGRDGIFIAETEGAAPTKIFQPDDDVIATSTPLWSPIDKRLIFTTATKADKDKGRTRLPQQQDPAGDLHAAEPTLYTCWLRSELKPGQPLNVPLFTVPCGHPGYVAANLAVRWHPDGQHLLYIKQDNKNRHGLYEYDLQAKSARPVFPHTGSDLVFDWAPDNTHLACVVGENTEPAKIAGVWIGKPGMEGWRQVPDSAELNHCELADLQAARPIWTRDSDRFAFVTTKPSKDKTPAVHTLHVGSLDARHVQSLTRGEQTIRDLHWRPDGSRLGFLCGDEIGVCHLVDVADKTEHACRRRECVQLPRLGRRRRAARFCRPAAVAERPREIVGVPAPARCSRRNLVLVAPDADPAHPRIVFSGMQVTFPQWSPKEAKLSLWATFRPSYRSWLSHLIDLGGDAHDPLRGLTLRPGDPALVLDPASGEHRWKAIDSHEKTQVGHYHLLHREYAEAWNRYEQAAAGAPAADDPSPRQFVERFVHGHDALFFHSYCLTKLGRDEDARTKRRQFEETFLPDLTAQPKPPTPSPLTPFGAADLQPTKEQLLHGRDLYLAEVFLSLDGLEDGERFFRAGLQAASSDADRLSKSLVLTQFLLLRGKHEEYAELATKPCCLCCCAPGNRAAPTAAPQQQANLVLAYSDGLSLLPLFAPEFLAGLSEKQVRDLVPRWRKLRPAAEDDIKRLGIDLFLEAAARRLGQDDERYTAARRIAANPARNLFLDDKGVTGLIEGVRSAPEVVEAARQIRATVR